MSMTDTETTAAPTPVEQSNASAALPGAGGASAAYGSGAASAPADTSSTPAATPAPTSEPYATMTTPTDVGLPNPKSRPALLGQDARSKDDYAGDDIVVQPAKQSYVAPVTGVIARGPGNVFTADRGGGRRNHSGVDMTAANGTPVVAAIGGTVRYVGDNQGYGMNAIIVGDDGNVFRYATHATVSVKTGQRVEQGQEIGTIGAGHLHFEVVKGDSGLFGSLSTSDAFVSTSWPRGRANPGVTDPLQLFGIERSLRVSAGQPLGQGFTPAAPGTTEEAPVQYAGDPFGVSASKAAAGVPNPPPRPVPSSALAFAEAAPQVDPIAQVLSTDALSATVLDGRRTLDRGSRGPAVAELQQFLNMHGFTDASGRQLTTDGNFGRRTREATKAFQEWARIEVDGRVGPETVSAALYTVDPESSPMPGKVAYDDGAAAAQKIIAPAEVDMPLPRARPSAREVDIALPRERPERGAGIPDPRQNPRRQTAQWSDVDAMTEVDTAGNYVRDRSAPRILFGPSDIGRMASDFREGLVAEGVSGDRLDKQVTRYEQRLKASGSFRYASGQTPAEIGRMVSDFRDGLIEDGVSGAILDRAVTMFETSAKRQIARDQRVADASRAGAQAIRQRLSDARTKDDRFRPRARAADTRTQDEIMLIRSSEAVREFARGIGDTYRRVIHRQQYAPIPQGGEELSEDLQKRIDDDILRVSATPAETVTDAYRFRSARA